MADKYDYGKDPGMGFALLAGMAALEFLIPVAIVGYLVYRTLF